MDNIEVGSNGEATFASRVKPAWHGLGVVLEEGQDTSLPVMLEAAKMANWNVRTHPLTAVVDGVEIPVAEKNVVLRDNPFEEGQIDALGIVGDRYHVMQNEDVFRFGETLVDMGAQWETIGGIREGRTVFGAFHLPVEITLDAQGAADVTKLYLLIASSHDGTMPLTGMVTPVRVVCQNTLNMALRGAKQQFKIRHTQTMAGRVEDARKALGLSFKFAETLEAEARALFETSMNDAEFNAIVRDLYPSPDEESKAAYTRWGNKVVLLGDLFKGKTQQNIAGTAWAGLNALTERIDWHRTARGGDGSSLLEAASGFNPQVQAEKNRIRSRVLEFAGIGS